MADISFGANSGRSWLLSPTKGVDFDESVTSPSVTEHSGLPLHWGDGAPLVPARTLSGNLYAVAKRAIDVIASVSAIVTLAPMLLMIALAIKITSPGPALFRQLRAGRGDSAFQLFKFRTMRDDACDQSGVAQTRPDDERVTPIGRWLRRSSLDELPQLFNILLGDMSVVGPRPHVAGQLADGKPYAELVAYYELRRAVRPGLTGWAQANGLRGPTDDPDKARARIEHDMAYIQNASVMLDLRIILLTARDEFISGSGN